MKLPIDGSPEPLPLAASDEATDNVTYLAERIQVAVEKTPLGAQKPGEVIPFKLKTTNTAPRSDDMRENEGAPDPEPIIRGHAAVADGKPQLIFDPDAEISEAIQVQLRTPSRRRFAIPSTLQVWTSIPRRNFDPVTPGGEPFGIEFTSPEGVGRLTRKRSTRSR